MFSPRSDKIDTKRLTADLSLIEGGFTEYLRGRHTADFTIALYCRFLGQVARFLVRRGYSALKLRRCDVAWVMRGCLPGWKNASRRSRKAGLHQWLRFIGHFDDPPAAVRWQPWLNDYDRFLKVDRALAPSTRNASLRVVGCYLAWQFRRRPVRWDRVHAADLCRYASTQSHVLKPKSMNGTLSMLRQFFRFIHLRGRCSPALAQAVPTVADYGRQVRPEVLDDKQRQTLLDAFDREAKQGSRDYALALCLVDLGLRAIEVARLKVGDIDWQRKSVTVPPAKTSRGRQLPLPAHVARALRAYLYRRPKSDTDYLFVGVTLLTGRPLTPCAIRAILDRAYRRCGFLNWFGTHRLRHSFATRLYARGATTKEIADLLGHRFVTTTDRYTQTEDLRALAQPWPL
jgi:site-specific recombinase XerD